MKKRTFIDYSTYYGIYKILPLIFAVLLIVGGIAFGIVDASAEVTAIGDDLGIFSAFIWALIGIVAAVIVCFLALIVMSPTVIRTDATLEILETLGKNPIAIDNVNLATEDELPEL